MSQANISSASANVYFDYDEVPPHPGEHWTRFVCISDTHSRTFPIPSGDVLLHAGDLSSWGYQQQLIVTIEWLKSLPHAMKIIIAGNHDICLDEEWDNCEETVWLTEMSDDERQVARRALIRSKSCLEAGIHYLEYQSFEFKTTAGRQWKVYGSPASEVYARGAFQYSKAAHADVIYRQIPPDTEILLTHTPPFEVLDQTRRMKHAGCSRLGNRLRELDACRLHVFGHIHEAHGAQIIEGRRVAVNAALAMGKPAVIVDLKN